MGAGRPLNDKFSTTCIAFYDTIKSRMDKYLKDNAIVPIPKKRARVDTDQSRVDLLPAMEDVTLLPIPEEGQEAEEHGEDNHSTTNSRRTTLSRASTRRRSGRGASCSRKRRTRQLTGKMRT